MRQRARRHQGAILPAAKTVDAMVASRTAPVIASLSGMPGGDGSVHVAAMHEQTQSQ